MEEVIEEIREIEQELTEIESEFNSMAFSAHDVFKCQLRINKSTLKILKKLVGYSEPVPWR